MSLDKFGLQSNNGKQIDLQNLKELKKSDLGNNNALIQLFNIFDTKKADGTAGSDGVLNKSELISLFNTFNAGANSSKGMSKSVFELNEAEEYLNTTKTTSDKTLSEIGVKAADLFEFLSKLTQNSNTPVNVNNVANDVHLTEEQAQEEVISTISEDTANARTLLMKQDNGHISQLYNKAKELFDSDLSLSNVEEAFMLQEECLENLSKAKEGKLSKREYFLQNREHLKTMMKRRLFRKDENTGLDFLDNNRGKMSKQEFAKFMEDYINEKINEIDRLDSLNKIQHSLLTMGASGVNNVLKKYQKAAQNKQITDFSVESKSAKLPSKTSAIPQKYNTTEPMTFKEVFEIERNQEYSKDRVEAYISQKQKTDFAVGAYNKYQSFKMNSSEILNDYTKSVAGTYAFGGMAAGVQPNPEKQMQKVLEAFESYYANPIDPNSARNEIEALIKDNKLPISVIQVSDGKLSLDLSKLKTDVEKNNVLNKLLKLEDTKLEAKLKTTLGGEVDEMLEMFSTTTQIAFTNAYGHDFTNELVQEMSDDNKTVIQRYTGNASQIGMGLTVVGGVLCFTPLAGVGAAMVGVGNTMAIGGMVAESALGFEEALSRSNLNLEEIKELSKTLVMNAGGFVVGYKAGQTGMKAFNKLIDKKLAEVFKTEMANGNRAEALKQVFSNPEYLKNFMQAAGVKLSADFMISYAGDLAMMGILDTNDDWKSLLQSNLIGIMTSMGGDLKNVADMGIKGNKVKAIQSEGTTNNKVQELADLHNNIESKNMDTSLSQVDLIRKQYTESDVMKLKSADPTVRTLEDGTVVKTNNEGKTIIIGKLYRKLIKKANTVFASMSPKIKLLNSTKKEYHSQLLSGLKNNDGSTKYTSNEIKHLLNNLPQNMEIKGCDLYALMTLPEISIDNAIQILAKVDSPEKLKVLNLLTDLNNRTERFKNNLPVPENELNALEIEYILTNLENSNITNLSYLFNKAINNKYNRRMNDDCEIPLSAFLARMSFNIKTDLQANALLTVLDNSRMPIRYDILFDSIINKLATKEDYKFLESIMDNIDPFHDLNHIGNTFSLILEQGKNQQTFLKYALSAVLNSKKYKAEDIYWLIHTLTNNQNRNFSYAKLLNMLKKGVDIDDIVSLVKCENFDTNTIIGQRIFNGKYDYDMSAMYSIKCNNDFQKLALNILLDANTSKRFEALAVKDIISNIKDANSLILLAKMLKNPDLDINTIINNLKTGNYTEPTICQSSSLNPLIKSKIEQSKVKKMLGIDNTTDNQAVAKLERYITKLAELNSTNPKRLKKILDSGLFDLIKQNKIDSSILKNIGENTFLSNRTLADIKKIHDDEPIIKTISSNADLTKISSYVANGEVCEFNGKLYVNEEGNAVEIKLSRENFEKLFPPLSRVSFEQASLGNCWLISTLDNFMDLPLGRSAIYKLFEQQGNDILIKFPNGLNPIRFKDGEVINADMNQVVSYAEKKGDTSFKAAPIGMQMVEQAFAIHRHNKYDTNTIETDIMAYSTNIDALMKELKGGWQTEAVKEILGEDTTFDAFGLDLKNRETMKQYIQKHANDENILTFLATRETINGHDTSLAANYDLNGNHAYAVKGYDETTGMVYISNPWHTSVITEVPLYELMKYIDDVNIAYLKPSEVPVVSVVATPVGK